MAKITVQDTEITVTQIAEDGFSLPKVWIGMLENTVLKQYNIGGFFDNAQ
jgi:hypothetical protein